MAPCGEDGQGAVALQDAPWGEAQEEGHVPFAPFAPSVVEEALDSPHACGEVLEWEEEEHVNVGGHAVKDGEVVAPSDWDLEGEELAVEWDGEKARGTLMANWRAMEHQMAYSDERELV